MLIQSKVKRTYWRNVLLNSVPDLAVAAVIAYLVDGGWWICVAAYFSLQALYLLVWLKNALWGWSLFYLFGRREAVQGTLGFLREKGFPEPADHIFDGLDYVREVTENKSLPDRARLEAAGINGAFGYLQATGQMQQGVRFQMVLEDAIQLYKASFPPPISRLGQ